ncbi:phasin family protein [Dapis sp. BLCC M126]|uniref:phasin family protein n=1 Tax=Dapis sp. BLCC M126 TaxID=3400189 RepID=UPI003CECE986
MDNFGGIIQRAVYLGVGLASFAGEKANQKLTELRTEAQKLADEMVKRGEMTTEEARRFVEDMMTKAMQEAPVDSSPETRANEPRRIEILSEDDNSSNSNSTEVDQMRQEVHKLQEELRRLQKD